MPLISQTTRDCLADLLGWRNHYDATEIPNFVDTSLNNSDSGQFLQDFHPAMRLDLVKACLPANKDLEEYLSEVRYAAVDELINKIWNVKKLRGRLKEILESDTLFNGVGTRSDTENNLGRFVGIKFHAREDIAVDYIIEELGLQFTEGQTDLKVFLYHTEMEDAVMSFLYNSIEPYRMTFQTLNQTLSNFDKKKGVWYLGYFQDDIAGQAINYNSFNWLSGGCTSCGSRWNNRLLETKKYMQAIPFYVPSSGLNSDLRPDDKQVVEVTDRNFGFNIRYNVRCSINDLLCDNRDALIDILGLQITHKILNMIKFSQQSNFIERNLEIQIIRDLEGDVETRQPTILQRLNSQLEAVNLDFSNLGNICLQCEKKGLRNRVI